jgi:REP element-mobilizing transposase RayT
MARPPRLIRPGAVYHVTARGNARQNIFFSDKERLHFVNVLRDNLEAFDVTLYAGVLMSNHFHLLMRLEQPNLSDFMQRLQTSYAMYVFKRYNRPGHLFQGRFKAKLVEEKPYLLRLTRYIHLNPVKTAKERGLKRGELISMLEGYPWSTYGAWVGLAIRPSYLDLSLLQHFGKGRVEAQRSYREYVLRCLQDDDNELKEVLKQSAHAIGGKEFVSEVEDVLAGQRTGDYRDYDVALPKKFVPIEIINLVVCRHFGINEAKLQLHGKRAGDARRLAIELACRLSGLNQREVGECYGGIRTQAVSRIRRQIRESSDATLRDQVQGLVKEIRREMGHDRERKS